MCGIWALLSQKNLEHLHKCYKAFLKISHRGPEFSTFEKILPNLLLGFHRLAIIDTSERGHQPFHKTRKDGSYFYTICNGEIYNYKQLIKKYDLPCQTHSDCEVIMLLYEKFGIEQMVKLLDGEFAFIIVDINTNGKIKMFAGRDPLGVRPIFYSQDDDSICISSEMKGLTDIYKVIKVFPPGKILEYDNKMTFTTFYHYIYQELGPSFPIEKIHEEVARRLRNSVKKRLMSDKPFGALLSGGLDSSAIVAIMKELLPENQSFPVFTIAFDDDSPDLHFAKIVASTLKLDHHIITVSPEEAITFIDETIFSTESWDITTVRCSVAQLILSKYIREKTQIRVLLCGENSDECTSGYMGFHYTKDQIKMHEENIKLIKNVHCYDGLRTDRTMAKYGLEIRLPFADPEFVDYYLSLPPNLRMPKNGLEKFLLRESCKHFKHLPEEIRIRVKNAFSDGITSREKSWFGILQSHFDKMITDEEFNENRKKFTYNTPYTKESYYYRKRFHEFFGDNAQVIPYFWLQPFSTSTDPSARTLEIFKD